MTRADDVRILRDALDLETLSPSAREAFSDMLRILSLAPNKTLTVMQRDWVERTLDVPTYAAPSGARLADVRHNHGECAPCSAECPAWTPPTLRSLPMKPPTRRV